MNFIVTQTLRLAIRYDKSTLFNRYGMNIGIVGLGLIGGSLALDLRQQHTILGVSRRPETCEQAIARKIVNHASPDLALMAKAEVIFLCTPLGAIESTVTQLLPYLSPSTILTDVGSVKGAVVRAIAPQWKNFVGGHPWQAPPRAVWVQL